MTTKTLTDRFVPAPGRVLLRPVEELKSKGGIVFVEGSSTSRTSEGSYRGVVAGIGEPLEGEPPVCFELGDTVFYEAANPNNLDKKGRPTTLPEVIVNGVKCRVAFISQIIGVEVAG